MILYNIGIYIMVGLAYIVAPFHHKVKALITGRKNLFRALTTVLQVKKKPIILMHCASLGEFEQGRPIIERLKQEFPTYNIFITFFSSSGYETCKDYDKADFVCYLPWDIVSHVKKFVTLVNPILVIFIKYEFWYNIVNELHKNKIPIILASALFRKNQWFFKTHGRFYRSILYRYNHFFVQDLESVKLLNRIGINCVTQAGDSRLDRVYQVAKENKTIPMVEQFKGTHNLFIAGSCWPEDIRLLIPFIKAYQGKMKFIIAPHEITESFLSKIEKTLPVKSIRYESMEELSDEHVVLLVDNIGLLFRIYQYGKFAYVGGAFGKGLHNILEVACYGIPVFFGNKNYQKFKEATDLIACNGAFVVDNCTKLASKYETLNQHPEKYKEACKASKTYVAENIGATKKIIAHCHHLIH